MLHGKNVSGPAGKRQRRVLWEARRCLKQTNRYSVVGSACDGVRAISLLKELKPDLLVVDLMLPQADGLSVLKAAAGLDPKPKLLVLVEFVTEYVSSMFMTLGVQYIMLKPCSCRAVVERLDEICESAVSRKPAIAAKRNANIESMVTRSFTRSASLRTSRLSVSQGGDPDCRQ